MFINQKQRTADNTIDLSQQALSKILLINDKAVWYQSYTHTVIETEAW